MTARCPPPEYHSPVPPLHRHRWQPVIGPTACFLIHLFRHGVFWGRRLARRGEFDVEKMVYGCGRVIDNIEATGAQVHVTGMANLTGARMPVVFVANHMSTLEPLILPALIWPFTPVTFVVKESLLRGRLSADILRILDPIAVSRRDPRADFKLVMEEGEKALARGWSLCIFPQTTRALEFDPAVFNTLGEKLARRAGVGVVPLALKTDFWSPGRFIKDAGRIRPKCDVRFEFGPVLMPEGNPKQLHQEVVSFIGGRLREWGVTCRAAAAEATTPAE